MYFVTMDPCTGTLQRFSMIPMQRKRFRAHRVTTAEAQWVRDMLNMEGSRFGTRALLHEDTTLTLEWGARSIPAP